MLYSCLIFCKMSLFKIISKTVTKSHLWGRLPHIIKDKFESNLSILGISECHKNILYKSFETITVLVREQAPISLTGQLESWPDPEAGYKKILMVAYRHIKSHFEAFDGRAFSWHPWISGTLKFDPNLPLFKCAACIWQNGVKVTHVHNWLKVIRRGGWQTRDGGKHFK